MTILCTSPSPCQNLISRQKDEDMAEWPRSLEVLEVTEWGVIDLKDLGWFRPWRLGFRVAHDQPQQNPKFLGLGGGEVGGAEGQEIAWCFAPCPRIHLRRAERENPDWL